MDNGQDVKRAIQDDNGDSSEAIQPHAEDQIQRDYGSAATGTYGAVGPDEQGFDEREQDLKKISVVAATEGVLDAMRLFRHYRDLIVSDGSKDPFWISCRDILFTAYDICNRMLLSLDDAVCDNLKTIEVVTDGPVGSSIGMCLEVCGPNQNAINAIVSGFCVVNMLDDSIQ